MIRLQRSINAVGLTAVPGGAGFRKLGRRKLSRLRTEGPGVGMARMTGARRDAERLNEFVKLNPLPQVY